MNAMLPVTSMLPLNTTPLRQAIYSDPRRLSYFNAANAVRAGTFHTWGALQGIGIGDAMPDHGVETSSSVKTGGALQTVGDLIGGIGRSLLGSQNAPPPAAVSVVPEPSPLPYILVGAGALALGGFVVYKMMK